MPARAGAEPGVRHLTPTERIALRELRDQAAAVHTRLDLRLDVPLRLLASLLTAIGHADLVLGGAPSDPIVGNVAGNLEM